MPDVGSTEDRRHKVVVQIIDEHAPTWASVPDHTTWSKRRVKTSYQNLGSKHTPENLRSKPRGRLFKDDVFKITAKKGNFMPYEGTRHFFRDLLLPFLPTIRNRKEPIFLGEVEPTKKATSFVIFTLIFLHSHPGQKMQCKYINVYRNDRHSSWSMVLHSKALALLPSVNGRSVKTWFKLNQSRHWKPSLSSGPQVPGDGVPLVQPI